VRSKTIHANPSYLVRKYLLSHDGKLVLLDILNKTASSIIVDFQAKQSYKILKYDNLIGNVKRVNFSLKKKKGFPGPFEVNVGPFHQRERN